MSNRLKNWLYWLSVVRPIYDIVRGAVIGIYNIYIEAKAAREHEEMVKHETEVFNKFRKDNEE